MSEPDRLKRRLLREVVQENLDTLQGVRRPSARRRSRAAAWRRSALLLLAPVALFGSSLLLHSPAPGYATPRTPPPAPPPPQRLLNTTETPPTSLLAPSPVDPALFSLAVRRVVLDPGHGGEDRGAEARGGLLEKELTVEIASRVRALLQSRAFDVLMTRSADQGVPLRRRADIANSSAADVFVSIHLNWIVGQPNCGVETYYLGPTDDPLLKDLTATENRDSGYNLADFRSLLDSVYAGVRQNESRRLAESVQRKLFRSLQSINPDLQDRGVKTAPFIVLVGTGMPAVLAEVSCLSNTEEAALLHEGAYRQRIAEALAAGIEDYAQGVLNAKQKGS